MAALLSEAEERPNFVGTGAFIKTVHGRVEEYFSSRPRRDDPALFGKASLIGLWFLSSFALLLSVDQVWAQIVLCISYALAASAVGFNIFHDSIHGSFSSSKRVNVLMSSLACMALGVGRYFWWYKHNILHHRFTNIYKWDDDMETRGHLRLSPHQPWETKFKNQQRFFFLLYCFHTLEWLYVKDFVQYFSGRINGFQKFPPMTRGEKLEFWFCKIFHLVVFVGLPFVFLPWVNVLVGMLLFHVILSLALAFVFNLAHEVEKAEFPRLDGAPATIKEEWAAHQMRTTVNFATKNTVLNWYAGGLNFQVEHHLFPHISHAHYPRISEIVERTAKDFGLPYHRYDGYFETVRSHFRVLRHLGVQPAS